MFLSFNAQAAWDSSVLVGEWEHYQYGYSHEYTKLTIKKDFTGSYYNIRGKSSGTSLEFKKSDFQFFEGFAVLNIGETFKILLSAWGSNVTGDSKRILGQLFIYIKEKNELKLINSIPISFNSANDEGFNEFTNKIKREQVKPR